MAKVTKPKKFKAKRSGQWKRVQEVVESVLAGKAGSTRTGAKIEVPITGSPRSAWWNFVWQNRVRQTPIYAALIYRGNPLVTEGKKTFLILSAEQVKEMRKAYRESKKTS